MKKIPKKISSLIMDTLPKDITDAIYIFGSYTTEYFDEENSDIDIAWFTNKPVEYSSLASYEFDLCELLGREVDLVIPDKSNIYFLVEVLSNPPIYIGNDEFTDWLDRFNDWVLDEYKFIENVISERCDLFE
ncbi:MAG: nucleotidyltransferase domain-containing protein [Terrisporobacter sp.]